jgi:hypothetical protein
MPTTEQKRIAPVPPGGLPAQKVRDFFARLSLYGKDRSTAADWSRLAVGTYFVAMQLPAAHNINKEYRPFGSEAPSLQSLFQNIKWS